jgi:hypothetical protein
MIRLSGYRRFCVSSSSGIERGVGQKITQANSIQDALQTPEQGIAVEELVPCSAS